MATATVTASALPVGLLNGEQLDDETLLRLAVGATSITAFTSVTPDNGALIRRWTSLAPDVRITDGGHVEGIREAMVECAKLQILVLATGEPWSPKRFVASALQGAAAATEFDVPAVAVHVMRSGSRPGPVAWLTDTGTLSGYGVLFAVGYAQLHGCDVDIIEPDERMQEPRTPEALAEAHRVADVFGIAMRELSDPSPVERVLRDDYCLVVHPVLDAPGGRSLLRPGDLPAKSVASGNPAAVVRLIEAFPGDVVAVFDGVQLLHGEGQAAKVAAGVALGVVGIAGVGTVLATPASAAESHGGGGASVSVSQQYRDSDHGGKGGNGLHLGWEHGEHGNHSHNEGHGTGANLQTPGGGGSVTNGPSVLPSLVTPDPVVIHGQTQEVDPTVNPTLPPVQGPSGVTSTTQSTPLIAPPMQEPVVVHGQTQEVDPTVNPTLPPVQGPSGVTSTTQSTPLIAPPLQPTVTPPVTQAVPQAVPTVTPPVQEPMLVPPLTPQVAPQAGPTVTPPVVTPMVVPTLQPQVPDQQGPVVGPTVTPPVVTPMVVPTLQPQVPDQQGPVVGPTVTPPVVTPMVVPTLQPQVQPTVTPDVGPVVGPTVQAPVDVPTLVPPLQATPTEVTVAPIGSQTVTTPDSVTPGTTTTPGTVDGGTGTVDVQGPGGGTTTPGVTDTGTATPGTVTPGGGGHGGGLGTGVTDVTGLIDTTTGHVTHQTPGGTGTPTNDVNTSDRTELAHTGSNAALLGAIGAAVLAAGAGLSMLARKGGDDDGTDEQADAPLTT